MFGCFWNVPTLVPLALYNLFHVNIKVTLKMLLIALYPKCLKRHANNEMPIPTPLKPCIPDKLSSPILD